MNQEIRQRIYELSDQGKTSKEIADITGININTVAYYRRKKPKVIDPAWEALTLDQKFDVITSKIAQKKSAKKASR